VIEEGRNVSDLSKYLKVRDQMKTGDILFMAVV
jgi:hypothetical protein